MRTASWSGLGLLAAALSLPAGPTAAAPAPGAVLHWPDVAAAARRHPLVREASARALGAAGAVGTARELPNPVLGASAGIASPRDGGPDRREWELSVELPLDSVAGRGPRVAAARAAEEGARRQGEAVLALVLRDLRRAFVALAHRQAVLETGAELEAQVAQLAALVRRRAEHGEGRPTEVARVEIELERLRAALGRSRASAEALRARLSTWLGTPVARVETDLSRSVDLPAFEPLEARTLAESPAIRAARAAVEAAASTAAAERRALLPGLSLGGARTEELDRRATIVTATVTLPLWSWNRGRVREAEAALEGERARLDAVSREVAAGLAEAFQGCAAGQSTASRFREQVLPRAELSARTLGRAFELGEAGLLEVVDARRVLLDTRREYLDLLLEMQDACGDLAALAGLELP